MDYEVISEDEKYASKIIKFSEPVTMSWPNTGDFTSEFWMVMWYGGPLMCLLASPTDADGVVQKQYPVSVQVDHCTVNALYREFGFSGCPGCASEAGTYDSWDEHARTLKP